MFEGGGGIIECTVQRDINTSTRVTQCNFGWNSALCKSETAYGMPSGSLRHRTILQCTE